MLKTCKKYMIIMLLFILPFFLTGCWDNKELDEVAILTGIALDSTGNLDQLLVTTQSANLKRGSSGTTTSQTQNDNTSIFMHAIGDSLLSCLNTIQLSSHQKLMYQHNQIRLYGLELAEQGLGTHLDMVMRDKTARLEIPIAIVDGRAEELLRAELAQGEITGIFIGELLRDLEHMSPNYRMRTIDFVSALLDYTTSPVAPILRLETNDGKQEIKLTGMAVFHYDKVIGRLSNDEALGFIWAMGDVKRSNINVYGNTGYAVMQAMNIDCKRSVTLMPDGSVSVELNIRAQADPGEVCGFSELTPPELISQLEFLAQEEIKNKVINCFAISQSLSADIFGFGCDIYRKYPHQWEQLKYQWDDIYAGIQLDVQATVRIFNSGQIVETLGMEKAHNED